MPLAKGKKYIVLARDNLSQYVEGQALQSATAKAVTNFVLEDIIYRYGYISQITLVNPLLGPIRCIIF
ncbi:hypothetical protein HYDPIDRAFT_101819 [Hydnomerulius pinastri MD-312]|uniref:Uncharacterized protein n=1 Tax=Hydnomerulius pinastri MD-312 TaxID=994086 RepID=A0A0C9VZF6_9AGAM|nr:hypothetical protein HYDPIDRAFT_101819 [Hydnomerulius pinastri MD-312]